MYLNMTFLPEKAGRFFVQYENEVLGQTYSNAADVTVAEEEVGSWKTVTIALEDAAFNNRQNGSADFRVRLPGNNLYVSVEDAKTFGGPHDVSFRLEYRSPVAGSIVLQYDDALTGTTYHSYQAIKIAEDEVNQWLTLDIRLPYAMFQNRKFLK